MVRVMRDPRGQRALRRKELLELLAVGRERAISELRATRGQSADYAQTRAISGLCANAGNQRITRKRGQSAGYAQTRMTRNP